jgi:hypothetical protein
LIRLRGKVIVLKSKYGNHMPNELTCFEQQIHKLLQQGYKPHGSVIMNSHNKFEPNQLIQPMIKCITGNKEISYA